MNTDLYVKHNIYFTINCKIYVHDDIFAYTTSNTK